MILFLLFALFSISSCVVEEPQWDEEVRPWSRQLAKEYPYKPPFVAIYKTDKHEMRFVAARHSNDLGSPTFKTIKKTLTEFKPDVVIIEPFEFERGESPEFFKHCTQKCVEVNFRNCDEASYTVSLIEPLKIPFFGGEPNDKALLNKALEQGYSKKDVLFFYTLRLVPQWLRQNRLQKNYSEQIGEELIRRSRQLGMEVPYGFEDFKSWFEKYIQKEFAIKNINTELVAPYPDKDALLTQKLSSVISVARDRFVVKVIHQLSLKYKNILVVYGGSHHATQKRALEKIFGRPKYKKLF